MDTCCFYEIMSSTQPTCLTYYGYNEIIPTQWFYRFFGDFDLNIVKHVESSFKNPYTVNIHAGASSKQQEEL